MKMRKILPKGTKVRIDIENGLSIGIGIIVDHSKEEEDTCVTYKIDLIDGENMNMHRDERGELWINSYDIKEILR